MRQERKGRHRSP